MKRTIRSHLRGLGAASLAAAMSLTCGAAAPGQSAPQTTSTTLGAWLVTCADEGQENARCEMSQRVVNEDGGQQILAATITAARGAPPATLIFTTPLGVWLEPGALLALPGSAGNRPLSFERCAPSGCLAPIALDDDLKSKLEAGGLAELRFADRLKQPLAAPVSLDGFADALAKLETTANPPPPKDENGIGAWFRNLRGG